MTTKLGFIGGFALIALACSSPETGTPAGPPSGPPGGVVPGGNNTNNNNPPGGQDVVDPNNNVAGAGGSASTENNNNVGGVAGGAIANAGAAGGGMGAGEILTGEGLELVPNAEGWVAGGTNGAGIQGAFYIYGDSIDGGTGTSVINPMVVDATSGSVCVSGTASQVVDLDGNDMLDYDVIWGGGIGLALGDLGAMMGSQPWDPGPVTGFSFTLSGDNLPASMRFQVETAGGVGGCVPMDLGDTTAGQKTFSFTQVQQRCWNDQANPPAPLPAGGLAQIQWQVVALDTAPSPFNFCIENLTAVQ